MSTLMNRREFAVGTLFASLAAPAGLAHAGTTEGGKDAAPTAKKKETVLIVAAHHEEVEAEFPNTAAQLAAHGCRVVILNPVGGWNWVMVRELGAGGRETVLAEAKAAAVCLGCEKVVWDYPVADLAKYESELIERMADFMLDLKPSILLMHWPFDSHRDHRFIARATLKVFDTAPNLVKDLGRSLSIREIYAFQTGVYQAYNFIPELLVRCTPASLAAAKASFACFKKSAPDALRRDWQNNADVKSLYWGSLLGKEGVRAEGLKFIGPNYPLDGFLLRKILGDDLIAQSTDAYARCDQLLQ